MTQRPKDTRRGAEPIPPARMLRMALVFYGALLAAAVLWSRWIGDDLLYAAATPVARVGLSSLAENLAIGSAAGLLIIWISREMTERTRWGTDLADGLADVIGALSVRECVILALVSGVAEEALFRGALQPQVGLLAATAIFALAHLAPRRELWPWSAFAAATGLLLGWLFEWTGNLVAPVATHVVVNAVNLRRLATRARTQDVDGAASTNE